MTPKESTKGNRGFALWWLTCFEETFVQDSTFVLHMNSSAKNPPQRKAPNRCHPVEKKSLIQTR